MRDRTWWRGVAWQGVTYGVGLVVALAAGWAAHELHPLLVVLVADVAATVAVFGFSRALNNSSMYDPYWSVAPMVIALAYWLVWGTGEVPAARALAVVGLVWWWGARLTWNFLRGWSGLDHEDWRYVHFRDVGGRFYWPLSFFGIHLMPTLMVYLGCLALWPALGYGARPLGWLDGVAAVVCGGAVMIEAVADRQLHAWVEGERRPGEIMERGLWRYSRHPNYFGEIGFWWGLSLFGLAAAPEAWWVLAGPLAITLLFVFVSLPLIDRRSLERRPGYDEHMRRVSGIIPWFRRE